MEEITTRLIWFRDNVIPLSEAKINIMTATAQYGINVFEGIRCYYNNNQTKLFAFRLNEHIERLFNSAKLLRFELDDNYTQNFLVENIIKIIKANHFQEDVYIRIGFFLDDEGSWSGTRPINLFILPSPKGRVFTDKIGVECCVVSWSRINEINIPPRIKSGANYINSRFAHLEAKRNNYDLAIFMDAYGKISEGTGACIFMVRHGKLITPPVTSSILESITRDSIIKFAQNDLNIDVIEREIDRTELYLSSELFFVGTSVEILPIISIDRIEINNKQVGHITKKITEKYFEIVFGNNNKYNEWLTSIY